MAEIVFSQQRALEIVFVSRGRRCPAFDCTARYRVFCSASGLSAFSALFAYVAPEFSACHSEVFGPVVMCPVALKLRFAAGLYEVIRVSRREASLHSGNPLWYDADPAHPSLKPVPVTEVPELKS